MAYAIYHGSKGKGSGSGIGNHIDRIKGKEHTYKHADPLKKHLNLKFKVPNGRESMPLNKAIAERISEGYSGKRKIRSDAKKFMSHVLTGSHEAMLEIFANEQKKKKWISANYQFMLDEFGENNLVRFDLHLDEKTPHIHAITVPLTDDGRLSAKEVMGNKGILQARQDKYAEIMKPFNLERGIKGTGIKHENANEYYKRIAKAGEIAEENTVEPVKGVLGIDKNKTIEKFKDALKTANLEAFELKNKLEKAEMKAKFSEPKVSRAEERQGELEADKRRLIEKMIKIDEERKRLESILNNPKKLENIIQQIKEDRSRGRGYSGGQSY